MSENLEFDPREDEQPNVYGGSVYGGALHHLRKHSKKHSRKHLRKHSSLKAGYMLGGYELGGYMLGGKGTAEGARKAREARKAKREGLVMIEPVHGENVKEHIKESRKRVNELKKELHAELKHLSKLLSEEMIEKRHTHKHTKSHKEKGYSVAELKEMCKERGIRGYSNKRKHELIQLLK